MGGGASSVSAVPNVHIVNMTNREEFLKECDKFYDTMQGYDGLTTREQIYSVLNGLHQASEILNIFTIYCPNGRMTCDKFIDFCRDCKLLDKSFKGEHAAEVYAMGRKIYYNGHEEAAEDVNFAGFLYHIVPELAAGKGMEEDYLTDRLARHHKPSPAVMCRILSRTMSMSPLPVKKGNSKSFFEFPDDELEEEVKQEKPQEESSQDQKESDEVPLEEEQPEPPQKERRRSLKAVVQEANADLDMDVVLKHQAAVIIQKAFRMRIAKRKSLHLKQIKKGKRIRDTAIIPKLKGKLEKRLHTVFLYYCPNDDIDREGFISLVKDGGLLCRRYLVCDAEYNFMETIAKVELADTPKKYSVGVRFKKRFTFMVFKEIALPFVALSTGMSYDVIVDRILQGNDT